MSPLRSCLLAALAAACASPDAVTEPDVVQPRPDTPVVDTDVPVTATPRTLAVPAVTDIAVSAGVQDGQLDSFHRGRTALAIDFDNDGWTDLYVGNPNDRSFIQRNLGIVDGVLRFDKGLVLFRDELSWAGSAADIDNDGDVDLFVSNGGNEGDGLDRLYRNRLSDRGSFILQDISEPARIQGPWDPATRAPIPQASGNGVWADYDQDGDLDLFVSTNLFRSGAVSGVTGRNLLQRNDGTGVFTDVAVDVGLGSSLRRTRHSTWFDFDNDGDLDLYESNYRDDNVIWRNMLAETGSATFVDASRAVAAVGADIAVGALASFASVAGDFNNDGWEDLLVFTRGANAGDCSTEAVPEAERLEGHHLYLNLGPGRGFVDVGDLSGINAYAYYRTDIPMGGLGVMGCQIGDVNADGWLDVFVGNGGPRSGEGNQLFGFVELRTVDIEGVGNVDVPIFADWTSLIDFPAPVDPELERSYPSYPYRTHGSSMADFDHDGLLELYVANGGTAASPDEVQEPDRLYDFAFDDGSRPDSLQIRLIGDGVSVPRQPVGARVAVTVSHEDGTSTTVRRTLYAGSAFSGQNTFDLFFGLGFADAVTDVQIAWPDGTTQAVVGVEKNTRIEVRKGT